MGSDTIHYYNEQRRRVEVVDVATGAVVLYQAPDGAMVQPDLKQFYGYDPLRADLYLQAIADGCETQEALFRAGIENRYILSLWKKAEPTFAARIRAAVEERAQCYRERAIQVVNEVTDKDQVSVAQLKSSTYWKAASHDSPEVYGVRQNQVDVKVGVANVIIETGIRRPGDPGFDPDIIKLVQEELNEKESSTKTKEEVSKKSNSKAGEAIDEKT